MAFSETLHSGDGVTTTFAVGFTYLRESYVEVAVDTVVLSRPSQWDFDGGGTNVVFVTPPASGTDNIIFNRSTDLNTRLVDFVDGAGLTEEDLDTSAQQLFDILQELDDEDQLKLGRSGVNWDAEARRITNLADPVDPQDAATFGAIQTSEANAAASAAAAATDASDADAARIAAEAAQAAAEAAQAASIVPRGYINGLQLERIDGNTLRVHPGECMVWDGTTYRAARAELTSAFDKDLTEDAGTPPGWVAGSGNSGVTDGDLTNSTWYHVFLLRKSSDGTLDIGFVSEGSLDTHANKDKPLLLLPVSGEATDAGFDQWRRIGSIYNQAAFIKEFEQHGDFFQWDIPEVLTEATEPTVTTRVSWNANLPLDYNIAPGEREYAVSVTAACWEDGIIGGGNVIRFRITGEGMADLATSSSNAHIMTAGTGVLHSGQAHGPDGSTTLRIPVSSARLVYIRASVADQAAYSLRVNGYYDARGANK